jgi:RNA polymerase sigma factor (sigma-70 family)
MNLPVDEAKRNQKAEKAKRFCTKKTEEAMLDPDLWSTLTPMNLAKAFNSTLPNGMIQTATVPTGPRLVLNPPNPVASLVLHYLPMVFLKTQGFPEPEDCAGCAIVAMHQMILQYDPNEGSLEDLLGYRVRNRVKDWRRTIDNQPQDTRRDIKAMEKMRAELAQKFMREPRDWKVRHELGWSREHLDRILVASLVETVSLDSSDENSEGESLSIHDIVTNPNQKNPADIAARRDAVERFARECCRLNEQQRKVLVMLYCEGLTGKEIGKTLGLKGARVSRIKNEAFRLMRDVLMELRETTGLNPNFK